MPSTVIYKGHRDRRDGTTEVEAEVEGKTYRFSKDLVGGELGKEPGPVPDAVVERLSGDDLKGHRFDVEPVVEKAPAPAPSTPAPASAGKPSDNKS